MISKFQVSFTFSWTHFSLWPSSSELNRGKQMQKKFSNKLFFESEALNLRQADDDRIDFVHKIET